MSDLNSIDFEEAQAYADGELSKEAQIAFEARLQSDTALQDFVNETFRVNGMVYALRRAEDRERLAEWEAAQTSPGSQFPLGSQTTRSALSDQEIFARASAAIEGEGSSSENATQHTEKARVVPFPKAASWSRHVTALAASFFVGAITLGLGYTAGTGSSETQIKQAIAEVIQQESAIRQASLENNVSGKSLEWSDPQSDLTFSVTPLRTFVNKDGVFCREYKQTVSIGGTETEQISFACRRADQGWIAEDIVQASNGI